MAKALVGWLVDEERPIKLVVVLAELTSLKEEEEEEMWWSPRAILNHRPSARPV